MISISNFSKQHGQRRLFENASLQINPGEKIGLVGPNGAGKTSLFRIIVKEEGLDSGDLNIPSQCVVGYFSQDVGEMRGRSALAEVLAGAGRVADLAAQISGMELELENSAGLSPDDLERLLERYGLAQSEFQSRGGYELESRAKSILTGLGVHPEDQSRPVESFSGGWKMRIALARILALQPDVLLMDEPTNHLDLESIIWLESWIKEYRGALLMTSHDREFMNRIVTRIVEVSGKSLVSYSGNYDFYLSERVLRREQLEASFKKQQDMLAKEEEFIARFAARASHAAQVQSRVKKLDKVERIEVPPEESVMSMQFIKVPRGGNDVVAFKDLGKTWHRDDGKEIPVFSGVTGMVRRLDKIAVVGVNGAGKSTFLKVLIGLTPASHGNVTLGAGIEVGYFSQHAMDVLQPSTTVYEEVASHTPEANISQVRGLLGAFLFSGDDVHKKVSVLSGGEKSRVVLASILAKPVNLLVLDEPTNHLDIKSREVLLQALQSFEGTVLIVSHDRHFLRELSTRVFEISDHRLRDFPGTYGEYVERQGQGR